MHIPSKTENFIIFQALGMLADALDADLEEGVVDEKDRPYVLQMMEDAKNLQDKYLNTV